MTGESKEKYELSDSRQLSSDGHSKSHGQVQGQRQTQGYAVVNTLQRVCSLWLRMFANQLRRGILLKSLLIILATWCFVVVFNGGANSITFNQYYPTLKNFKAVAQKKDLLHVNVSHLLRYTNWDKLPLTKTTIKQKFHDYELQGFVSNLDLASANLKKSEKSAKDSNNKDKDTSTILLESNTRHIGYDIDVGCDDLSYKGTLQYSDFSPFLGDDLIEARKYILAQNSKYSKACYIDDEEEMSEEDIIKKRWFRFGSSAVWMEKYQLYFVYSHLIYSQKDRTDHPRMSMIRGQVFDKEWNEQIGVKIPYDDIEIPADLDNQMENLNKEFRYVDCESLKKHGSSPYDICIVEQAKLAALIKRKINNVLSKYFVTYPIVFNLPTDTNGDYSGQENSRVVLRKTSTGMQEPVLIYNQLDRTDEYKKMEIYFPHRKFDPLVQLKGTNFDLKETEKNWTPFFHKQYGESKLSRGYIHFIYSFLPLEILKCNLDSGNCEKVFKASTLELEKSAEYDGMRGGTPFVPLPSSLPGVEGKQIWVGFPKLHAKKCGCGGHYYRPMLSVLVESNGVYRQELIVPVVDFNSDVTSWDLKSTYCGGNNIMSPNSINFWEVISQDPKTHKYEDYLSLTVSEVDRFSRTITLKGVLNYILGIYAEKEIREDFEVNTDANAIVTQTLRCVVDSAFEQCKAYGLTHKSPE